jgi:twitching motility protein PilT
MARLDSFPRIVAEQQASDLHFHAGSVPVIRYEGDLLDVPFRTLSAEETSRFIREVLTPEQWAQLELERQLDLIYTLPEVGRFRGNIFVQNHGLGAVFRVIPPRVPTIDDLQLPPVLHKLALLRNGIIIVTGPTGSGKTTTLAALVDEINRTSARHVITIEDPIEFVHTPVKSAITQRQVGRQVESFASGLRSALRESPDVLVVGEMRDAETVSLALAAAETGVLVLGTLHTNSAAKAVDRIVDATTEDAREQSRGLLSVLLRAVIAQHLVKRVDADGRIAATEVLVHNYAVANMIREDKTHQLEAYVQSAGYDGSGSESLGQCLFRFVRDGLVSLEEALTLADHPNELKNLAAGLSEEQ